MKSSISTRCALAAAIVLALGTANAANTLQPLAASEPSIDAIDAASRDPHQILLRAGSFDPLAQRLQTSDVIAVEAQSARYAIVQFAEGRVGERERLESLGVKFLGYVPNNAYQVRLNGVSLDALRADPAVRWAEGFRAAYKFDPTLWNSARSTLHPHATGVYRLELFGFAGESADHLAAAVRKLVPQAVITGVTEREDAPRVRLEVTPNALDAALVAAATLDGVAWVAPFIQQEPRNTASIGAIQGNSTSNCTGSAVALCGPTPLWDHGLLGTGQIVAVSDSGSTPNMAYFTTLDKGAGPLTAVTLADTPTLPNVGLSYPNNKVYAYWVQPGATAYDNNKTCPGGSSTSFHGTHTTGTVVGDAAGTFGSNTYTASTPTSPGHDGADGMAPNAQLLFQDIGNDTSGCLAIDDLRGTLQQTYAGGARIHSASWGASDNGAYASDDNNVDYALSTQEDLIFVVAAGNDGSLTVANGCVNRVGSVCYQSIGSPGNAKNAITIGALAHGGQTSIASFSSRGPTADGRLKPDIMAPGSSIFSASGNLNVTSTPQAPANKSMSGTSMATPTVAGNAALVRQFFGDGFYPRGERSAADTYNISGMALKAVLLNGTNPFTTGNWAGNDFGWGRAWLDSNLWFKTTQTGGDDSRRLRIFERTNAAGVQTGDVHEYTIDNVQAGQELRATLTWYDPEALPGVALALINNLDLEVVAPDGTTVYKGNVFASGYSTTGGNADTKNSVEQVRLNGAGLATGRYLFRVKAISTPGGARANTVRQGYALAVSGAFGLPDQPAFAAPTSPSIIGNDANGVRIGFNAASGAQGFQLYRANGTCASAAAGDFRLVASSSGSPIVDTTSQGGFGYAYKVRGISNDVEGDASTCVDVLSNASCTLQPTITGAPPAINGRNDTCAVNLSWQSATPTCPAATSATYTIERSTDPFFTNPSVIASGVNGTSYTDTSVQNGTAYFYRFRAFDNLGNASLYSGSDGASTSSSAGPDPLTFSDNAEGTAWLRMDPVAWGFSTITASDGTHSYHTGGQNPNYPDLTCAAIETPALTIPAGGAMSFMARYNLEYQWDGVVTEISTDGGSSWNDLPPTGGYPTVYNTGSTGVINACGYANNKGIYSGVTTTTSNAGTDNDNGVPIFKPFSIDLAAYAGQTVKIRWRLSSDPGLSYSGFFLDQVRIGNLDILFRNQFDYDQYMCH